MAGYNPGGLIGDIYSTGKDIFLSREYNKQSIERQAAGIETQRVLSETAASAEKEKRMSQTTSMIYLGVGLLAVALFIGVWKSI